MSRVGLVIAIKLADGPETSVIGGSVVGIILLDVIAELMLVTRMSTICNSKELADGPETLVIGGSVVGMNFL